MGNLTFEWTSNQARIVKIFSFKTLIRMHDKLFREKDCGDQDKSAIILAAASQILSKHGYAGVTISRVAAEAGVSRGLLHYYFRNKEDMLAKVLRDNMGKGGKLLGDLSRSSDSAEQFASRLIEGFRNLYDNHRDFFTLFMEGITVSRQSDVVRKEMNLMYMEFRNMLKDAIDEMSNRSVIDSAIPAGGLASMITALFDGLGLQLIMIPDIWDDDDLWTGIEKGILHLMKVR